MLYWRNLTSLTHGTVFSILELQSAAFVMNNVQLSDFPLKRPFVHPVPHEERRAVSPYHLSRREKSNLVLGELSVTVDVHRQRTREFWTSVDSQLAFNHTTDYSSRRYDVYLLWLERKASRGRYLKHWSSDKWFQRVKTVRPLYILSSRLTDQVPEENIG